MILGLVEHDRGKLNEISLQMLTFGKNMAEQMGTSLEAVLIGEEARALTDEVATYGVSKIHLVTHEQLTDFAPEAWGASLVHLSESEKSKAILASGTDRGNEVMAHVAAKMDLPLAANCTEVKTGDVFEVTRVRWGGSLLEDATLTADTKLLTIAPHTVEAVPTSSADVTICKVAPPLTDKDLRVKITRRDMTESDKVSLTDAKLVVSGGRGVGSSEGFAVLEELAGIMDGAVGCSRAVTSHGWRPHSDQVGQTGARVAPELYMACGISGAIQHLIGCKSSKHILAINTDKDAPIVTKADYAVIGDLHEVLPAISEALRSARHGGD